MRMKLIAVLAATLAPGLASASCEVPADHVEQRQCSERQVAQLSRQVQEAQQLIRARISAWDEEPEHKVRSLALFNQSVRQFRTYQADQCEFEASVAAGGNGAGDMRLECQIGLYSHYLKSLQEQATWFEAPHA